jgi:hypothetical protein
MHYDNVSVQVEVKSGAQVPKAFTTFLKTTWFTEALEQAQRIAELSGRKAGVSIDAKWLIVRLTKAEGDA